MSARGFMLWPDGSIDEVDEEGESYTYPLEPGLFDDLLTAGYPLHKDPDGGRWDGIIDLRVEDDRVICHTNGPAPHEHDMGPAGELFLAWYRENAAE